MKKFILLIISLISSNIYAQESFLGEIIYHTNDYRKSIHGYLVNSAYSIDNYYFEERKRNLDDYNSTYGLMELSVFYNREENLGLKPRVKVKLNLPKLKDKFKLVFESEEDRDSTDYVENHTSTEKKDYNLSLLYNKFIDDSLRFKAKLGLRLNKGLDPFVKIELKKSWIDRYYFDYIFSNSLKQSVKKKLEYTSYFEIIKPINENFSVHIYNEYYWNSPNKEDSEIYNSLYLNQKYSKKNYFTYQIDSNTNNKDSSMKVKRYSAKVKYRHFLRKWLYLDVIPENYYRRDNNFKSSFAIKFNLGLYFSRHSYK